MDDRLPGPPGAAGGGQRPADLLLPAVYEELRRVARRYLRRERADHTLQTTALVHEAYLRLVEQRQLSADNRAQFVALAASMMRRILVNHALSRSAGKRGGGGTRVALDDAPEPGAAPDLDVLALHRALEQLERLDERQGRIVELRFFGGLGVDEVADALGVSAATVHRDWATARLWLRRAMSQDGRERS